MFRSEPIISGKESSFYVYFSDWLTWWNYFQTYSDVFEATVARVEAGQQFNHQALPTLFLMRHTLELGLKAQIFKFETVNSPNPVSRLKLNADSHKISVLLSCFKKHVDCAVKKVDICEDLKSSIEEFQKGMRRLEGLVSALDKDSQAFRYPVAKDGTNYWTRDHDGSISHVINLYFKIQPYIIFTDTVFAESGLFEDVAWQTEIESTYVQGAHE